MNHSGHSIPIKEFWNREQWAEYAVNKKVAQFTDGDINAYLIYMRTECIPPHSSAQ